MIKEQGIANIKPFRLKTTFDNGLEFNDVFPAKSALFREDGTLLAFNIRYNNGEIAHIVLVPENEWLEEGMQFIENWLAPIGLAIVAGRLIYSKGREQRDVTSLAQFGIGAIGMEGLKFLTGGIRDTNLIYVNMNTGTRYLSHPLQVDTRIIGR